MCELTDTVFVEKKGVVWVNLECRRKPECKTPYEKPKQEEGFS